MKQPKIKAAPQDDDAKRMRAGQARLAELLANPGPGITVTPVGGRAPDGAGQPRAPTPPTQNAPSPQHALQDRLERAVHRGTTSRRKAAPSPAAATPSPQKAVPPSTVPQAASRPAQAPTARIPGAEHLAQLEQRIAGSQAQPAPAPKATAAPQRPPGALPVPKTSQSAESANGNRKVGELADALRASRDAFVATALFSLVINVLMLAGPLFMLQVYDRVMTSGSIPTLLALAALTAGAYAVIGILELVRSRVIVRVGMEVDSRVTKRVFDAALARSVTGTGHSVPALRELDGLRQFLAGQGPITLFDAPWTPVYLLVIFLMHWWLGVAATIGALLLLSIAWISEVRSRGPIMEAGKAAGVSLDMADTGQRNAEAILAMGMTSAFRERWQKTNEQSLAWQMLAADRLGGMTALSKALRLFLQSVMLAIGAALALQGQISAGAIVAATIIFGRALAPVEQAIGQWRAFLKARDSYDKLDELLKKEPAQPHRTGLPAPKGYLEVRSLRVAAPQSRQLILANVNFKAAPGHMLAIIGPSASGKSSLVRALVGLWAPVAGSITIDGARLDQWDRESLGRHIGYLPQSVELFAGTVKENIARFMPEATDAEVIEAARHAHAHDLIMGLSNGYDTELGAFATHLSAGQRQRIALARALFRQPRLVVLDEPNANLDRHGDVALSAAIDGCRERGQTVILVSHRVQAISKADLIVFIERGVQRAFGPRDDVMAQIQSGALDAPIERRQGVDRRAAGQELDGQPDPRRRSTGRRAEDVETRTAPAPARSTDGRKPS